MPLLLIRDDITNMKVDAIVNPANKNLKEGSGTSYAIYKAAGRERLKNACRKIGYCELGKSVITEGYDLCKYIIHTVGPVYDDGFSNENDILAGAYRSALELAARYQCSDIAFPLLSSGNYGFPKDVAMKVAVSAIQEFLWDHEMMVYLVLYDAQATAVGKKITPFLDEKISDQYVEDNNEDLAGDEFYRDFLQYELNVRRRGRINYPYRLTECIEEGSVLKDDMECASLKAKVDFSMAYPTSVRHEEPKSQPKKPRKNVVDSLLKRKSETFPDMLFRLIDERGLKDSEVYKKANMSKQHFNKIKNKEGYTPKKATVYSLALALQLSLDETIDLLAKAGHAFSDCSKTDIIIKYYIENEVYDIFEINEVLFDYNLEVLGV